MNVEELKKIYVESSKEIVVKVRVEGYLYGFEVKSFPNTRVKNGAIESFHGSEIFYTAVVQFPEGQTQSFHIDYFGTNVEYHKLGGGKLWIPIHAVELVK